MVDKKRKRRVPQQARSRERYDLILDAAAWLFAGVGYEAATTNAIAKEADVPIGSLYQYFAGKEDILHALADRYLEDMQQLHEESFGADISGLSIEEIVDRQIDPYIAFSEQHLGFKHAFLGAEVSADLAAAMAELDDAVVEGIKTALQRLNGQLSDERATMAATVLKGMVKGLFGALESDTDPAFQAGVIAEYKRALADYIRRVAQVEG
jgi:AcrR family transcriptional regulator